MVVNHVPFNGKRDNRRDAQPLAERIWDLHVEPEYVFTIERLYVPVVGVTVVVDRRTLVGLKRFYILRGVEGEIDPCGADIFDETYEVLATLILPDE